MYTIARLPPIFRGSNSQLLCLPSSEETARTGEALSHLEEGPVDVLDPAEEPKELSIPPHVHVERYGGDDASLGVHLGMGWTSMEGRESEGWQFPSKQGHPLKLPCLLPFPHTRPASISSL